MATPPHRVVVTDTNVLINLMHVSRLSLCGMISGYEFVIPNHVYQEITDQTQISAIDSAIAGRCLVLEEITDINSIVLFTELIAHVGRGEAACLAIASEKAWYLASDERGRFLREAVARIGETRIIGTPDIFMLAISKGLISIDEADADKAILETKRYKMPFGSFRERVRTTPG